MPCINAILEVNRLDSQIKDIKERINQIDAEHEKIINDSLQLNEDINNQISDVQQGISELRMMRYDLLNNE